jgi:ABC-type oligopeptide transport system substrate-binding subunit/class 3 adenylate cyclase
MQCPQCNRENPKGAKFCGRCGAKLARICAHCGAELPPDAEIRFCFECGAELRAAEPAAAVPETMPDRVKRLIPSEYAERLLATRGQVPAERRMVTILFSDVKGSTAMAEDLDPEDVMEIMDGAFDVLIEPVYRYEGTLARLMGDAVLAFFGAPIAHEDDPERAVRAALDIIAGAQQYAAKLEQERGITGFSVRVGINTGLVVVGEVGSDLRVEYTAMGDAINLAARMESAAEPGTVLITEATHRLVAPLFETEALGPIQVKGKAEPVAVYRVLAAREAPGKMRGIAGLESPLVGREAELRSLREALECLEAGVGGIVTIIGDAGIGKSRLVAEVRKHVVGVVHELPLPELPPQSTPLQWVEGRCLSYGTSIAYLLWVDVLRGLLGVTAEHSPEAVRDALYQRVRDLSSDQLHDVYPCLSRLLSLPADEETETVLCELEGERLKASTFDAVERLIRRTADQRPLVLVCEDLHWADPTSIELLEQVLALVDRASLLLVCLFRPNPEHGSWRLRETAARTYRHRHTDLWLDPLSAAEGQTLLSNILPTPNLLQGFQERILQHAEGNPLYVEEIIRSLIDSGAIMRDSDSRSWTITRDLDDMAVPETLQGVLVSRIDRLQEQSKRVLQMASVIGRSFLYRVLSAIAEEERELDAHLLALQREQMIRERARIPELEYIFKHELTREAAYGALLKKDRRIFHRQVGQALERLFPERIDEQVGLLAYHWDRAGDPEKAVHYLQRAGDAARLMYSHDEAIDYYERALMLLKKQDQHERAARTLMKLALTYHTAFDFPRSRQAYEEGFALWQRAGEVQPVALPPAPHALRTHWESPNTLDPAMATSLHALGLADQLFSGLAQITPDMDVIPDVAQSWEVLEGGRQYIFRLRDDVRWSDGTRVTAADFEYAWKRVLNPASDSPAARLLYDIKGARAFHHGDASAQSGLGVQALDSATLVVGLEEPAAYFLHLVALCPYYPVPRHVVHHYGSAWTDLGNLVTNGPFLLEAWQRGESIALVRNPHYHGSFRGNVQRVELSTVADVSAHWEMYQSDRRDITSLLWVPDALRDRARQVHAGEYVSLPDLSTEYVGFDVSQPPFDDLRVRQALVLATDRDTLAHELMKGLYFPASGGFVPPGMPGHSPGIGLLFDPEQARQLLAQAGYPEGRGFPGVDLLTNRWREPHGQYLEAQWRQNLGLHIPCRVMDWATLLQRLDAQQVRLSLTSWLADYPDPDSFLRTSPVRRYTQWRNEAYDRLVEQAGRSRDHEQRMKLYVQADRILVEEAAIMPLVYGRTHLLVKPWVSKLPTAPIKLWFWKDVVIDPH